VIDHLDLEPGRGFEALGYILRHVAVPVGDHEVSRTGDICAAQNDRDSQSLRTRAAEYCFRFSTHGEFPFLFVPPQKSGAAAWHGHLLPDAMVLFQTKIRQ
jgi:hypothetical protein